MKSRYSWVVMVLSYRLHVEPPTDGAMPTAAKARGMATVECPRSAQWPQGRGPSMHMGGRGCDWRRAGGRGEGAGAGGGWWARAGCRKQADLLRAMDSVAGAATATATATTRMTKSLSRGIGVRPFGAASIRAGGLGLSQRAPPLPLCSTP